MTEHIPYMAITAIGSFAIGFAAGGCLARWMVISRRWRQTRHRIEASEVIEAMKASAKAEGGAACS